MRSEQTHGAVAIYRSSDGSIALDVRTDGETVWLTRQQLASLFGRDVKTIGKHVINALNEELEGMATVAKFATVAVEGERTVERRLAHYNLDMVISVGYRVKSVEGVHFRRWATDVLRKYIVAGVAINDRRLAEIGSIVTVLSRSNDQLIAGVADVLSAYLPGLRLLRDYDEGAFEVPSGSKPAWRLTIDEAREVIASVKSGFPEHPLLGAERGESLAGVVGGIYQGFGGQELYPSVQEKAANLLYLIVKDHPLADGNKRSAAALFVTFLSKNSAMLDSIGRPLISNNALAAITLMIAMSDPREKDLMTALVVNMLAGEGS